MMGRTTSQLRKDWAPACNSSKYIRIDLHGQGRVTVDPRIQSAVKALNDILVRYNYLTRRADTGAYNCRPITGGTGYSIHAYGVAIDINWQSNPYGKTLITDMPRAMVNEITAIRTNNNCPVWEWGGNWRGNKDAMHYEIDCTPVDLATGIKSNTPIPIPPTPTPGDDVPMFCLVQPNDGRGVYRFDGTSMMGVPNPTILGGDQIVLAVLGLPNQVIAVDAVWFNSWPITRG